MKHLQVMTSATLLVLLAGCARVHGPRDPGIDARMQTLLEKREAMYGHEFLMNLRLSSSGCAVRNDRGLEWRYRSTVCRSD